MLIVFKSAFLPRLFHNYIVFYFWLFNYLNRTWLRSLMKLVATCTTYTCNSESKSCTPFVTICFLDYYLCVKIGENIISI